MMIRQVTMVNWVYIGDAVPSFITIASLPQLQEGWALDDLEA